MEHRFRNFSCAEYATKLLLAVAIAAGAVTIQTTAHAQSAVQTSFSVPAGPLTGALTAFGRQAGVQVNYPTSVAAGKISPGVSGTMTPEQALSQLLAATGLSYQFTSASTVTITDPATGDDAPVAARDDSLVLDTITIESRRESAGWDGRAETVYSTPSGVSYISKDTIERYRGQNAGDIFRATPGVLSAQNRTSGAIDPNIRGMQGMNRIPVSVDGAVNQTSVYRGYQGMAGRSYIDPDFIGGVSIEKGPSTGPGIGGIGGSVSMRTIGVGDIVQDGQSFGFRLKGSLSDNSTAPEIGKKGGWTGDPTNGYEAVDPTVDSAKLADSRSGSAVIGYRSENFDLVGGIVRRRNGNYHAGKRGPVAQIVDIGPYKDPWTGYVWPVLYQNIGLTRSRAGEEVMNTSQDVTSVLIKAGFRFLDDHALELGVSSYKNIHGEIYPSEWTASYPELREQEKLSKSKLLSYTARYRWNPADNDRIDLKWNLWATELLDIRNNWDSGVRQSGLMMGTDTFTWGMDLSNTSAMDTRLGDLTWEYGLAYINEDSGPNVKDRYLAIENTVGYPPPDGTRDESTAYSRVNLDMNDQWSLNAALRYQYFTTTERFRSRIYFWDGSSWQYYYDTPSAPRNGDGFSPSIGLTYAPVSAIQLFANYRQGLRFPSRVESGRGFQYVFNPNLGPERSNYWEAGINGEREGILSSADQIQFKWSYFNNRVDDYIVRQWKDLQMRLTNIDAAKFSGTEVSLNYQIDDTIIGLTGNYYFNMEFCNQDYGCVDSALPADFANNQIPPKYMAGLSISQKLLAEALTIGGRATYYSDRLIDGSFSAGGAQTFIAPKNWDPYTLVDIFAQYQIGKNITIDFGVDNLTDRYYVDPLNLALIPSPGRTIRLGVTVQ